MERHTMFLDWKNQYCENDYTTQSNLQIQCNPYQITNGIFHRIRAKKFTICMETQKTLNSQSNLEEEKWSWRSQAPWPQTILQSYSHQNSMVGLPWWCSGWESACRCRGTGSCPGPGRSHMPRSGWARKPWRLSLCIRSLCSATGEATAVRGPRTAKNKNKQTKKNT